MTLTAWLQLAGICLTGAMSPGPSLVLILQQASRSRRQGVCVALGHAAGVGLYALAATQGLALLLSSRPELYRIIALAGAACLLWFGIQSLRSARRATPGLGELHPADSASSGQSLRQGLLVALSNPQLALFFVALLSQFVAQYPATSDKLLLIGTAVVLDLGWYALLVQLIGHPPILRAMQRQAHWVNHGCGLLMILLGLRMLAL